MKVAIVGSRSFPFLDQVTRFVHKLKAKHPDATVISGGARGVDRAAEDAAQLCGLHVVSFRPKQRGSVFEVLRVETRKFVLPVRGDHGGVCAFDSFRDAAFARNEWIVSEADVVVAFWDGKSRGTLDSINRAKRLGKNVWVYPPLRDEAA